MKTVQLVALVMLGCVVGSRAETTNYKVDSLKRLLQSHQVKDRAEVLWNIAYELFDVDNPQALFYAERAYQEVWAKGDSLQIVKVGTTYGQLLRRVGEIKLSIDVSSKLLPVSKRHDFRKYTKMLLNSLQLAYLFDENYKKGLELAYESISIRKRDGDSSEVAVGLANLGLIFYRLNDYQESIAVTQKVLGMSWAMRNPSILVDCYTTIGSCLYDMGRFEEASVYFQKGILIDSTMDQPNSPQIRHLYALSLFQTGQTDLANNYALAAKALAERSSNKWALINSCLILTEIAMKKNDLNEAEKMFQIAESVATNGQFPALKPEVLLVKARLFAKSGKQNASIELYEKNLVFLDSAERLRTESRIRELHVAYEEKENEIKIKSQAGIMELQTKSIRTQRKYLVLVAGLLLVVAFLAIKLFRANEIQKNLNHLLDAKVVERTTELVLQRDELVHSREEQIIYRKKVYGELRDQIASLAGIIHLGTIDRANDPEVYFKQASMTVSRIDEVARKLVSKTQMQ